MRCSAAREALSALMDDEGADCLGDRADEHLERCRSCQAWHRDAAEITRRVRIGRDTPGSARAQGITDAITADVARRRSRRVWSVAAMLVTVSGALQLAISAPLLVMAHHRSTGHPGDGWMMGLALVVGAAFFLGTLVLLWHTKGAPQEPAVPFAVAPAAERRRQATDDVA
jgi:hypothetical protein